MASAKCAPFEPYHIIGSIVMLDMFATAAWGGLLVNARNSVI